MLGTQSFTLPVFSGFYPFFFLFFFKAFYLLHSQQLLYIMLNPAKLLTSTVAKKTLAGASREILESIK